MILTNAVPGGIVVALLGFWQGVGAILVANLIMLVYVGLLSHRAGSTGESFALQATETFGRFGYIIASGFLASIVVGWFAFNTGATGATLNSSFGWNEKIVIVLAGLAFIAVTYAGIRALSFLGAIAARCSSSSRSSPSRSSPRTTTSERSSATQVSEGPQRVRSRSEQPSRSSWLRSPTPGP